MQRLLTTLFLLTFFSSQAQDLYMPRDVRESYKNGTRSMNGTPGKNYWQNHGRYDIHIATAPPDRTVTGTETISYINNSPDTLRYLTFKLIVNIHKPGAARFSPASPAYLTDGITIDLININGESSQFENGAGTTVDYLVANKPLAPKDSAQIFVKWHYEASVQSGREGMIDSTTYFLAYAYPRVAVYDDYAGWDYHQFNDGLEFYNDFNDYTLSVQVPANYVVWATGTLLNPTEVLQPQAAGKLKESLSSNELFHIATLQDLQAHKITTQAATNTWKFSAFNVPDVAFGLSDHFAWDASSVIVDTKTGRRASVQAAYNDTAKDYHYMVESCKRSLQFFSNVWPGVPYPYEKTTVFQGYAGMEYPMMANDETYEDTSFSKFVAAHEIAHTYMPFYMGINESRYGFMDEGWATTFEYLLNQRDMGAKRAESFYKRFRVNGWINDTSPDQDLPVTTPGQDLYGGGLGSNQYGKPSLGYLAVKDYLGDDLFKKCLHAYMDRWHGKHPLPWDFFFTFNDVAGKDLNWFWNNWFFSHNYIDLTIEKVNKQRKGWQVIVGNTGGMAAPFDVLIHFTDGSTDTLHQTIGIWQANEQQATVEVPATKKEVQSIEINGGIFMDANTKDNSYKM